MAVRRRGKKGIWQYDLMIRKTRYRGSLPEARTKQEALDAEAAIRRAVYEGRWGRQAGVTSFEQFLTDVFLPYSRQNRKRCDLDAQMTEVFRQSFGGKKFSEFSPMLVERFKKELKDGGRRNSTVNQYLAVLHRVFSLAVENGYTNSNPVQKVRRLKVEHRARYMTRDEETELRPVLASQFPMLLTLFDLILNTGMRHREATGLRRSEVDLDARTITLPLERTKEKRRKVIPLNPAAFELVTRLCREADRDSLFGRGYEASWVDKQWKAACREAGVSDLKVHDLRHTFATRLAEAGVSETAIMGLLGHSSLRMTTHYAHPTEDAKRAGVEALEKTGREIVTPFRKTAQN